MMVFILVLFLPLSVLYGSIVQVSTLAPIQISLDSATTKDLIVFDVDNTLLVAEDKILRPCGAQLFLRQYETLSKMVSEEEASRFVSIILLNRAFRAVDEQMPELVRKLQERSVKVIALTALSSGRLGMISSLEEWRRKELLSLGFDFSEAFPKYNHIVFGDLLHEGSLPIYKDGILYSTRHYSKGEILQAFLRRVKWLPERVIFVDDKREYIDSVHETMLAMGIECCCYHYCNEVIAADVVDEEEAERQFVHLRTHKHWPPAM